MNDVVKISDTIDKAADEIERRGWVMGAGWDWWTNPTSRVCLEGAIAAAKGIVYEQGTRLSERINLCPTGQAIREFLSLPEYEQDFHNYPLYSWNDRHGRDMGRVVATLREAAEWQRERESA